MTRTSGFFIVARRALFVSLTVKTMLPALLLLLVSAQSQPEVPASRLTVAAMLLSETEPGSNRFEVLSSGSMASIQRFPIATARVVKSPGGIEVVLWENDAGGNVPMYVVHAWVVSPGRPFQAVDVDAAVRKAAEVLRPGLRCYSTPIDWRQKNGAMQLEPVEAWLKKAFEDRVLTHWVK